MEGNLRWLSVIGLFCDIIGAFVLASGLLISKKEALELGMSYWVGDTDEENLQLPPVRDRLRQARNAKIGVALLTFGFALQIIGNWPH